LKKLERLRYAPRWVSHLGCLIGCLDYLGLELSDAWLYGSTGHAFILNIHPVVCPSGPTAWNSTMLFELGHSIGYAIDGVVGHKGQDGLVQLQERAWEHVRQSIDVGLPCYAWELDLAEYYLIYGYDDVGYCFAGPSDDGPKGPKPWQELGETGVVEAYSVRRTQPSKDAYTVQAALSAALKHASGTAEWIFPEYRSGLAGYDLWIRALEKGGAVAMGMAYNAAVWAECRGYAPQFLQEAGARLPAQKPLFDRAAVHYAIVARQLAEVSERYPFSFDLGMEHVRVDQDSRAAGQSLKAAREAEAAGLKVLAEIVETLGH
jgi:hypothetical protein